MSRVYLKVEPEARFFHFVELITETGCWIWMGATRGRYGVFWNGEIYESSHRFSYRHFRGQPKLAVVAHMCDVSFCVNPAHLFDATQSMNIRDCVSKGRFERRIRAKGERCGRAILTEEKVREIRSSKECQADLAKRFGVTFMTISAIIKRRTWRHI